VAEPGLTGPVEAPNISNPLHTNTASSGSVWFAGQNKRWRLSLLLFLVTLVSTTLFGSALQRNFETGRPFALDGLWQSYVLFGHGSLAIWSGLQFSLPLLTILLAHELGHYLECRRWQVDASLPYFLPSPTLFGTLGAFIRIRSPIYTRKSLFDIGIMGPLAGFAALLPFLITGVWMSRASSVPPDQGSFVFGAPLALRLIEWLHFGNVDPAHILLHPFAMAAWVGLLATAMNLLPIGQLDGGHIVYALLGERGHRLVSLGAIVLLALLGFSYRPWWFWALATFFFFRRHPLVYDLSPLSSGRVTLAAAGLLVFILSASIVPIRTP
jgi:Zn-dependent protease